MAGARAAGRAGRAARARLGGLGRARAAALGLLRGGLAPRRSRAPCGAAARASSTPTTCNRRSAGGRWRRRARRARGSCCTCTSTGSCARSASASRAAPSARAATGATRCPGVLLNCRGSVPEALAYAASLALWQRRLVEQADAVIVPSDFARERLRELGAPLPLGARARAGAPAARAARQRGRDGLAESRPPPGAAAGGLYALVVSRLAPEKGVDVAIEACRMRRACRSWSPARAPSAARLEARAAAVGDVRFARARRRRASSRGCAPARRSRSCPRARRRRSAWRRPRRWRPGLPVAASRVGALPELLERRRAGGAGRRGRAGRGDRRVWPAIARPGERGRERVRGAVRAGGRGEPARSTAASTTARQRVSCAAVASAASALITGITGQDGSFLAELLLEKGYAVTGMVRGAAADARLLASTCAGGSSCCAATCSSRQTLRAAIEQARPRELYHLAAPSFVPDSWERPGETWRRSPAPARRSSKRCASSTPTTRVFVRLGAIFGEAPGEPAARGHAVPADEPVRGRQARGAPAGRRAARARRPARQLGDPLQPRVRAPARAVRHAQDHPRGGGDLAGAPAGADARLARGGARLVVRGRHHGRARG